MAPSPEALLHRHQSGFMASLIPAVFPVLSVVQLGQSLTAPINGLDWTPPIRMQQVSSLHQKT